MHQFTVVIGTVNVKICKLEDLFGEALICLTGKTVCNVVSLSVFFSDDFVEDMLRRGVPFELGDVGGVGASFFNDLFNLAPDVTIWLKLPRSPMPGLQAVNDAIRTLDRKSVDNSHVAWDGSQKRKKEARGFGSVGGGKGSS